MTDPDSIPNLRIVWDVGRLSEWAKLLSDCGQSSLTQGFGYNQAMLTVEGWRPRLGIIELSDRPIGLVVMSERRLFKLVRIARLHRGPLLRPEARKPAVFAMVMKLIRKEYPSGPLNWTAVVPEWEAGDEAASMMRWAGFRRDKGPGYRTIWLDLRRDLADLRAGLDRKWRNHLNQSERSGLVVETDRDGRTLLPWLLAEYAKDKAARGYRGPSTGLVQRMRTGMYKDGDILILRAVKDGEAVAGILVLGHGKAATYQIGWSGPAGRKLAAHNLLLWRAVAELKAQGRDWFDLGGLLPDAGPGFTSFKRGMGGEEVELVGAWR